MGRQWFGVERHELRFGLLGPPALYESGTPRVPGSPKVRVLLAALLLGLGRTVSVDTLTDALWNGRPPASARASLHNHVTRLRRLLDDPERLRAVPPGYILRVEPGELDVHVFDSRLLEARSAHAFGDWGRTVRACEAALALWRGTPLADLPSDLGEYAFAERLREARLLLMELRFDAELALGQRLDAIVPELASLTAEHPLREAFHRQLMLALHRTGRQAEALAVHRDLRARLVEELGVEPGPAVARAHAEILRPPVGRTRPVPPTRRPAPPSPGGRSGASAAALGTPLTPAPSGTAGFPGVPDGADGVEASGAGAGAGAGAAGGAARGADTASGAGAGSRAGAAPGTGTGAVPGTGAGAVPGWGAGSDGAAVRGAAVPGAGDSSAGASGPRAPVGGVPGPAPTGAYRPGAEGAPDGSAPAGAALVPPVPGPSAPVPTPGQPALGQPAPGPDGVPAQAPPRPPHPRGHTLPGVPEPAGASGAEPAWLPSTGPESGPLPRRSGSRAVLGREAGRDGGAHREGAGHDPVGAYETGAIGETSRADGTGGAGRTGDVSGTSVPRGADALDGGSDQADRDGLGAARAARASQAPGGPAGPVRPGAAGLPGTPALPGAAHRPAPARGSGGLDEASPAHEAPDRPAAPDGPDEPDGRDDAAVPDGSLAPDERQSPPPPPVPAQLPPSPPHFTGRAAELRAIREVLTEEGGPAVVVVSGTAGVGKSALALTVAHGLRERFPDGQLYVHLHGATPGMSPLSPTQALASLLRDLGADPRSIPEDPDAAAALLRSMLAPTRTLMVLDDAGTAAQVRPLLPAGPGCAVIVTSRSPLTALDGARRFPLAPLSAEESAELLRAVSGRGPGEAADADRIDATHPLVELTGRLPLALRIVAARLAARRALTPDVLADQLAAAESRLRHLEYDDLSVRRSLAVAHDALSASGRRTDRDAALVLGRLGALDLPTYGAPLIARLLGTEEARAEAALDRLVDVALLEETAYGRWAPHDLVRDFARELAAPATASGPGATRGTTPGPRGSGAAAAARGATASAIARTAVRWYAAVAERAVAAVLEPGLDQDDRRRPTSAQPPEHAAHVLTVPAFAGSEEAFAWASCELENIVALAGRYADSPDDRTAAHVSVLLRLIFPYLLRAGRVAEMEVLGRAALRLARRFGDETAEAWALGDLAGQRFLSGRPAAALELVDQALELWRRHGRLARVRRALGNRGLLLETLGRYEESEQALRQSLELSDRLDDPWGEAVAYGHLGNLYEHTDPRAAIEHHRRSLAIGRRIGNVIVQHSAHCNIGYAHLTLGEPEAAVPHFEESRRILGRHDDWHGESQARLGLVRALRLLGRLDRAERESAELLSRAEGRADEYVSGLARHQYGLLLRDRGRLEEARTQWRTALTALARTDNAQLIAELRELLGEDAAANESADADAPGQVTGEGNEGAA